jgi:hypothetical protein
MHSNNNNNSTNNSTNIRSVKRRIAHLVFKHRLDHIRHILKAKSDSLRHREKQPVPTATVCVCGESLYARDRGSGVSTGGTCGVVDGTVPGTSHTFKQSLA